MSGPATGKSLRYTRLLRNIRANVSQTCIVQYLNSVTKDRYPISQNRLLRRTVNFQGILKQIVHIK